MQDGPHRKVLRVPFGLQMQTRTMQITDPGVAKFAVPWRCSAEELQPYNKNIQASDNIVALKQLKEFYKFIKNDLMLCRDTLKSLKKKIVR